MKGDVLRTMVDVLGRDDGAAPARASREHPSSLEKFGEQDITADGAPFTMTGREPVRYIIELIDRVIREGQAGVQIAILGAEQWGKTVSLLLTPALHLVVDYGRNVGYFLPTDKFAKKFGRTRLKNLIKASPFLREALRDRDVVNQTTMKEFNGHFFYLLGLQEMLDALSIPLDALLFDEVDLLPTENQNWSEGRVAASDLRLKIFAAAGYIPGGGIDTRWQEGTQHKCYFACPKRCSRATRAINLEETFPDCMAVVRGRRTRVCPRCQTPLDLARYTWIAAHPERAKQRKYSFRVSSLMIAARDADHIWDRWEKAKKRKSLLAQFRCAELAMPDAGATQPVTDAELERMRHDYAMVAAPNGRPRYAGMDTGDVCHFYAFERTESGRPRLVWIEEIDSDVAENTVADLIGLLGVVSLIIDKKPLTTLARALAYRFPRIVAVQDFKEGSTLAVVDEEHEQKKYRCVKVDRNESLAEYTEEITDEKRGLMIPRGGEKTTDRAAELLNIFADHHKNLRKERTLDGSGRPVDKFVRGVANHFGMAGNSARLAELIALVTMPFSATMVDRSSAPLPGSSVRRSFTKTLKRSLMHG